MKKNAIKLVAIAMSALTAGAMGACQLGTPVNNGNHKGKKEIVVSIYDGGLGTDWFDAVIEDFEADYTDYFVTVEPKKRTLAEIESLIALGTQADMYFSTVSDFHNLIYSDKIADISDVLEMKPDGETRTVGEKLANKETWSVISSKNGQGCYMLPYEDGIAGFNYDHDKFLEYGLLYEAANDEVTKTALTTQKITYRAEGGKLIFVSAEGETNYEEGDVILRAGKDNKYGTYDDGQPITMEEWDQMFLILKGLGKAVIYSGKIVDYTTDIFNGIFAQYDGVDAWKTFNTYNGEYTFEGDSAATKIDMETGYRVFGMTGIKKATEFLQEYLNNRDYAHDSSFMSEEWHTDAQGKFVIGSAKNSMDAPFTGLLVDGVWWENEASSVFEGLVEDDRYAEDYRYGTRDYRMMLYPEIPGQKGADGHGNGSVLSTRAAGSCIIPKQDNADILEKTKILLAYSLKDEHLRHFTKVTGVPRAYDYQLTAADKAEMTVYARNMWELYNDKANIKLVRPLIDRYLTPVPYMTSKGFDVNWFSKVGEVSYNIPISALRIAETSLSAEISADPVKTVFEGFEKHFKAAWPQYILELNSAMGK